MINIDSWLEKMREEERVRCPYCNFDVSFDRNYWEMYNNEIPVSYHGWPDEESKTIECPDCNKKFKVREHVRRTYETCKIDEEFE